MAKLIGTKKINIAVFITGNGSNLKNLIKHSFKKNSKFYICIVFSSSSKAKGLKYAKQYKIPSKIVSYKNIINTEKKILKVLEKNKIKLICLAGFMKILSKNFIKKFKGKILNIHPSLLPKYKGLNTHQKVLDNKEKFTGCTVHYVNSKLDSGKIIMQKKVKIFKNDTIEKIKKRVLKQEHFIYPMALKKVLINL